MQRLREIVARLRSPGGCPWDREQTHQSLRSALLEECYEAIDAINRADDANLREELGDLLLLVVMHARMGEERGAFHFDELAAAVCEKMIRRHPHVFAESEAGDSATVLRQWEQIKRQEKGGQASVLEGVAAALPSLLRAQTVQKKAGRVGFDWPDAEGPRAKLLEELAELDAAVAEGDPARVEEELGDLLFSAVNLARKLDVDAETALAAAVEKFIRRFQAVERAMQKDGAKIEDLTLAEMDVYWDREKSAPGKPPAP